MNAHWAEIWALYKFIVILILLWLLLLVVIIIAFHIPMVHPAAALYLSVCLSVCSHHSVDVDSLHAITQVGRQPVQSDSPDAELRLQASQQNTVINRISVNTVSATSR